ncbi:tRNA (adenosine(37)-N6)-threonylcarbamoyltransferase complex ATPase subunit type 1 TsaE [Oceanobacillus profundus]|uniref:tRNA threonylcarbamoyladenosine biosynthesis protein TsaE n=1 Tax=Oceanobacillus profundus TaxID=372463 RepID=A0A417Y9D7_9BACI|nr:tRNA (adenosine(37)-N6)-threonylcarbamoyltransferase complex ATPase subunit type 1 TsaE [Oceanobacillus profundus]MBR3121739.1 tRNA (adenosine(37)-N6)-threonylcarbamoyltransferase complex ATPase subunit type 1 TsaE [Oceanobacillus sp.]PAE26974.1 tRNA (adenosine(37)-N6)-threonylcarbamoyltransferase complex ATPase subunit type 1 TsaE [Paenibacillus sp. 7884-2]MCM3397679.1 tRNA (adenosine(37)-N6)-threonylcarbamoyltransferase complex ATPase subunit type 1 TsaE [Oceanobacillus profundus]MDO645147
MVQIQTNTVAETQVIAEKLATLLKPGDVITLEGELGAGKTTFTKGLAKGLGVKRNISSPTFTIIKEYEGTLPLYHMDVYRLEHSDEDIGFEEYFHGNGITVVEWAQFIEEFLPNERLAIRIGYIDEDKRILEFTASSSHFEEVMNELIS